MKSPRGDAGSVTVELATALPAVVVVLGLVLAGVGWARAGVVAADAAAVGARVAAVEGETSARATVARAVPGAEVEVTRTGSTIAVTVTLKGATWLPPASATSVALTEP